MIATYMNVIISELWEDHAYEYRLMMHHTHACKVCNLNLTTQLESGNRRKKHDRIYGD